MRKGGYALHIILINDMRHAHILLFWFSLFNRRLLFCSDKVTLEKSKEELQQNLEVLEQEVWHLRRSNTELQLKGDRVDGEKEEQQQEMERMLRGKETL